MKAVSVGEEADGTLVLVLRGELDYTNAGPMAAVIRETVAHRQPRAVCVDLAAVSFLDSSGIGVLVQALHAAEGAGAGFRVRRPSDKVFDQLRSSGLLELFGLADAEPEPPG